MLIAALALVILVVGVFFVFIFDSLFGGLDFSTSPTASAAIVGIIKSKQLEAGKFYDLGSCRGDFAIRISKALPSLRIYGIDNSRPRTMLAKIRGIFLKNLIFCRANIFSADVSSADIIYIYLPQDMMRELSAKLKKELKQGALIITNSVSFPDWQASQTVDLPQDRSIMKKLFVYQQP